MAGKPVVTKILAFLQVEKGLRRTRKKKVLKIQSMKRRKSRKKTVMKKRVSLKRS